MSNLTVIHTIGLKIVETVIRVNNKYKSGIDSNLDPAKKSKQTPETES